MTADLWRWSAAELADSIRTGGISSREALASCIRRVEEVNPRVNAVIDLLAEEAFAAADLADKAVRNGQPLGPLHGVPITVKINVDYANRATTNGVVAFKDNIVHDDSAVVANLRKAGAVIFGRTNVPCFSTRLFTDNDLYGRTYNPWDSSRTPGGSSGGAAAAVAVGIGALAHGNDRAGSIRFPAYACGIYGLRPSVGRVAEFNPGSKEERNLTSQLSNTQGPLGRSIADLRLGLAAMSARDHRDPWWLPACQNPQTRTRPTRVALFAAMPDRDIDPIVTASIRQAGKWLQDAGYEVEEAAPPRLAEAAHLFWDLVMTEERAASAEERSASSRAIELFGDEAVKRNRRGTFCYSTPFDFEGYIKGLARRATILRDWLTFLEQYPVLVMPVSWKVPFAIDYDQQGDDAVRLTHLALQPSIAVSLLGLPALAAPVTLHKGVPIGVQVVAGRYQDEMCLSVGEVIQARSSVKTPIDPFPTLGDRTT
jgi:amidase